MKTTVLTLFIGLMLAVGGGVATAGPDEDGSAAYGRGDYATALRLFRPLADQGSTQAQYKIGLMYYSGEGVAQDLAEATKWYRRAADPGQLCHAKRALHETPRFYRASWRRCCSKRMR
jgi:uncharacterized protein